jgi:hypothetical protein
MNFLELAKRLRQEAGLSGTGPSAVTGQTGESKRIVDWISEAWNQIQLSRKNWLWMRGSFSFSTSADDEDYTPAEAGIAARFSMWDPHTLSIYRTASGLGSELPLPYLDYNTFIRIYHVGPRVTGMPVCFTIGNDRRLLLGPKPDGDYTVSGEYWRSIQTLSADSDEPEMPAEYHMLIVFLALELYGLYDAAPEVIANAKSRQRFYRRALENNQLPMIEGADPLA